MRTIIPRWPVLSDCKIVWDSVDYVYDINDKKRISKIKKITVLLKYLRRKNLNATKIISTIKIFMWLILFEHI